MTYAYRMFGKRYRDLTSDEKRKYYTWRKQVERELHPDRKERDLNKLIQWGLDNPERYYESQKVWRANNRDKVLASQAKCRAKKGIKPFTQGLLFKMFGVHGINNLTIEQKREYLRVKQREYYRRHKDEILGRDRK